MASTETKSNSCRVSLTTNVDNDNDSDNDVTWRKIVGRRRLCRWRRRDFEAFRRQRNRVRCAKLPKQNLNLKEQWSRWRWCLSAKFELELGTVLREPLTHGPSATTGFTCYESASSLNEAIFLNFLKMLRTRQDGMSASYVILPLDLRWAFPGTAQGAFNLPRPLSNLDMCVGQTLTCCSRWLSWPEVSDKDERALVTIRSSDSENQTGGEFG